MKKILLSLLVFGGLSMTANAQFEFYVQGDPTQTNYAGGTYQIQALGAVDQYTKIDVVNKTGNIDQFIIDLRLNGGGDNTAYASLLDFISEDPFFEEKGRLYILIGRATFSAGINLVTDAELNSNAILVGEPTGGSPNQYGDPEGIVLPNSKVRARISTIYWNKIEEDNRLDHRPNISVPLNSKDYFMKRDRALDTIINN